MNSTSKELQSPCGAFHESVSSVSSILEALILEAGSGYRRSCRRTGCDVTVPETVQANRERSIEMFQDCIVNDC
jgi:hypothetical protein